MALTGEWEVMGSQWRVLILILIFIIFILILTLISPDTLCSALWLFLTDMGIVKVAEKGFYGFKWGQIDNGWGWVLSTTQDTFQNRGSLRAKKGDSRDTRRKKKRKK